MVLGRGQGSFSASGSIWSLGFVSGSGFCQVRGPFQEGVKDLVLVRVRTGSGFRFVSGFGQGQVSVWGSGSDQVQWSVLGLGWVRFRGPFPIWVWDMVRVRLGVDLVQ